MNIKWKQINISMRGKQNPKMLIPIITFSPVMPNFAAKYPFGSENAFGVDVPMVKMLSDINEVEL
jgi:hypothetical protein